MKTITSLFLAVAVSSSLSALAADDIYPVYVYGYGGDSKSDNLSLELYANDNPDTGGEGELFGEFLLTIRTPGAVEVIEGLLYPEGMVDTDYVISCVENESIELLMNATYQKRTQVNGQKAVIEKDGLGDLATLTLKVDGSWSLSNNLVHFPLEDEPGRNKRSDLYSGFVSFTNTADGFGIHCPL